jgi:hypothetical protein
MRYFWNIAMAAPRSRIMKTVQRFTSFEDLKASDERVVADPVILMRHRAFERLMFLLRSKIVRKGDRT